MNPDDKGTAMQELEVGEAGVEQRWRDSSFQLSDFNFQPSACWW
jgi:hypothetical protein